MSVATALLARSFLFDKRRQLIGMHPWGLMEQPPRDLFLSWQSEDVPSALKKANVISVFKDGNSESKEPQNIQPHGNVHNVHGNIMEQILPKVVSR